MTRVFSFACQSCGGRAASPSVPVGSLPMLLRWEQVSNSEPFARTFYMSWPWIKCARAYKNSKGGLCERCWSKGLIVPGEEVHHKIRLTPENLSDPAIALNWDNLCLLCKKCHLEEHDRRKRRYSVDEMGRVDL